MTLSARKLDKMIKEATVDCYDELEQASGFFTMIEDHLALPFATEVLGVEVSVVGVEMDDNGSLKAVCERNGKRQLIGLIDLELPKSPRPAPSGLLPIGTGSEGDRVWGGESHIGRLHCSAVKICFIHPHAVHDDGELARQRDPCTSHADAFRKRKPPLLQP